MGDNYQKYFLFLVICIGLRSLAVYLAKVFDNKKLKMLGFLYLAFAIGILSIYFLKLRNFGAEAVGQKIWWNNYRPLFGLIWLSFAILAIVGKKDIAWKVLFLDVILGLGLFINKHFI